MWRLLNGWLPFQDKLQQFGLHLPSKCSFCPSSETLQHSFVHCWMARYVWSYFQCMLGVRGAADTLIKTLQGWWILASGKSPTAVLVYLLPVLICWELWKARNQVVYENVFLRPPYICRQIVWHLNAIGAAHPFACANDDTWRRLGLLPIFKMPKLLKCIPLVWSSPQYLYSKLNVDGSSLGNPGHSGGGGLVRDYHGQVIAAFSAYYGFCTNMEVESRALLEGLLLCVSLGLVKVIVHMDSEQLLKIVQRTISAPWKLDSLVRQIHEVLSRGEFVLEHSYRETNAVADELAKQASTTHIGRGPTKPPLYQGE
ncbi:uncharacterized protein [Coffea arabica]|uniref:RNase H type-1 domain-containing protein n=1 Tax=Coffea arabica TaxID=13443 RepID=A0ABM4U624_COFAR